MTKRVVFPDGLPVSQNVKNLMKQITLEDGTTWTGAVNMETGVLYRPLKTRKKKSKGVK
jgi:hypothetical protein